MNHQTFLVLTAVFIAVFATSALAADVSADGAARGALADVSAGTTDTLAAVRDIPVEPPADGVTVFYFHRTIRCETCLAAEAFADTLVHREFPDMIEREELAWIVLDIDEEENAHFIDEYDPGLFGIVISVRADGVELYWKSLEGVADLAAYRGLFDEYVLEEVRFAIEMLADGTGGADRSNKGNQP